MDSAVRGSGGHLRFTDFSVFPSPRPNWVMVMLRAYFDDSGEEMDPQHKACSLFGYAADGTKWPAFETAWQAALDKAGMPYFHMKEFAHHCGPFAPFRDNEPARRLFIQDLGAAIGSADLQGFGSIIRLADLRKFNQERGLKINDYALNLYVSLVDIAETCGDDTADVLLDNATQRKMYKVVEIARSYVDTDPRWKGCDDRMTVAPLAKGITFKEVLPIQAADFIAWESRKDITDLDNWFDSYLGDKGTDESLESWKQWAQSNDRQFPYNRGSLAMLTETSNLNAHVWDYAALCRIHEARNGSWPTP